MSFYVKREKDIPDQPYRTGWTGPIRSANQAEREAQAWRSVGWGAAVLESTPEVRKRVRDWEKSKRATK